MSKTKKFWLGFLFFVIFAGVLIIFPGYLKIGKVTYSKETEKKSVFNKIEQALSTKKEVVIPVLDKEDYDKRMLTLANNPPPPAPKTVTDLATGEVKTITPPAPNYLWPKKTVYPNAGAILPFKRIIAYYGNLYSTKMGVLGQYPEAEIIPLQHHFAHVFSCMAENELTGTVLGFSWDGTGYGTDGTVWGGECILVDGKKITRAGTIRSFKLPGGERAVKEPRRSAAGILYDLFGE